MKVPIRQMTEADLLERFPIRGKTRGWYFRVTETSNNVWLVEGSDVYGRRVSRQGIEIDPLLAECEADAGKINEATA